MGSEINGIDMDVLRETVGALRKDPELGVCRFRARNKWIDANQNVTRVSEFFAAKEDQRHKEPFHLRADEPPILAGDDSAPNPVEILLAALASCLTTAMVAHAAVRGIHIEELESEIEGDIDLNGYMGLSSAVPRGYKTIRIAFKAKSDATSDELKHLAEFSPVFNTILQGATIDLSVETSPETGEHRPPAAPA